tara:strand:- start:993 stop:1139 length:147 start_codon:yes stop_codon:yes gene_type:complete
MPSGVDEAWAKVLAIRHIDDAITQLKTVDKNATKTLVRLRTKLAGSVE